MTPPTDTLRSFYDRRHPSYNGKLSHWRFLRQCYEGGREWFGENVFKYHKEGQKEFEDRIKRAYRFNHTREVVDLLQKYLFKAKIARREDDASTEIKEFWANATLSGLTIDQFMRSSASSGSVGGRCAIVVDNNLPTATTAAGEAIPVSQAEAKTLKARVYVYKVDVEDILDMAWDEDGDGGLLWIKLREYTRNDADPINDDGEIIERQRLWTRNEWVLFEVEKQYIDKRRKPIEKVVEVKRGRHDLGIVPVHLHDHAIGDSMFSVPGLIDDVAYLDRAITNYLSNLDAIIQDQTFSQLAIPAQAVMKGDDMYEKVVDLGTKRIFVFDGGAGSSAKPEYLSPDPKQAGIILTTINKLINEIYHTIGLAGERTKEDNAVGIDNSSGVAKAYDFERVNSLLLSKAASCENAENKIVELVSLWHGIAAPTERLVKYPDTFDVMRLADDLTTAEVMARIDGPKELRREHMKIVLDKMFPQLKADLRKKIEKDIDSWLDDADLLLNPPSVAGGASGSGKAAPSRQGQVTAKTK